MIAFINFVIPNPVISRSKHKVLLSGIAPPVPLKV